MMLRRIENRIVQRVKLLGRSPWKYRYFHACVLALQNTNQSNGNSLRTNPEIKAKPNVDIAAFFKEDGNTAVKRKKESLQQFLALVDANDLQAINNFINQQLKPRFSELTAEEMGKYYSILSKSQANFDPLVNLSNLLLKEAPQLFSLYAFTTTIRACCTAYSSDPSSKHYTEAGFSFYQQIVTRKSEPPVKPGKKAKSFKGSNLSNKNKNTNRSTAALIHQPMQPELILQYQETLILLFELFTDYRNIHPIEHQPIIFQELRRVDQWYTQYRIPRSHYLFQLIFQLLCYCPDYDEISYWYEAKYQKEFLCQQYLPQQFEVLQRYINQRFRMKNNPSRNKSSPSSPSSLPPPQQQEESAEIQRLKARKAEEYRTSMQAFQFLPALRIPLYYYKALLNCLPKLPQIALQQTYDVEIATLIKDRIEVLFRHGFPRYEDLPILFHQQLFWDLISNLKDYAINYEDYLQVMEESFPDLLSLQRQAYFIQRSKSHHASARKHLPQPQQSQQSQQPTQQPSSSPYYTRATQLPTVYVYVDPQSLSLTEKNRMNIQLARLPHSPYEYLLMNQFYRMICFTVMGRREWEICFLLIDNYLQQYSPFMKETLRQITHPFITNRQTMKSEDYPIDLMMTRIMDSVIFHESFLQFYQELQQQNEQIMAVIEETKQQMSHNDDNTTNDHHKVHQLQDLEQKLQVLQTRLHFFTDRIHHYQQVLYTQPQVILDTAYDIMSSRKIFPPFINDTSFTRRLYRRYPSTIHPRQIISILGHLVPAQLYYDSSVDTSSTSTSTSPASLSSSPDILPMLEHSLQLLQKYSFEPARDYAILMKPLIRRLGSWYFLPPLLNSRRFPSIITFQQSIVENYEKVFVWCLQEKRLPATTSTPPTSSDSEASRNTASTWSTSSFSTLFSSVTTNSTTTPLVSVTLGEEVLCQMFAILLYMKYYQSLTSFSHHSATTTPLMDLDQTLQQYHTQFISSFQPVPMMTKDYLSTIISPIARFSKHPKFPELLAMVEAQQLSLGKFTFLLGLAKNLSTLEESFLQQLAKYELVITSENQQIFDLLRIIIVKYQGEMGEEEDGDVVE